jgi:hypothetical protein
MSNNITLSEQKLHELWSKGVLPDMLYVCFALEMTMNEPGSCNAAAKVAFDVESFTKTWSINKEDLSELDLQEGWKPKTLKRRSVLNAICVLQEKGLACTNINVQVNQMDLLS